MEAFSGIEAEGVSVVVGGTVVSGSQAANTQHVETGNHRRVSKMKVSPGETNLVGGDPRSSFLDTVAEAERVAEDWRGGSDSIIRAGVRIENYLRTAEGKDEKVSSFINELVKHGVLTPNDAKLGVEKSSKMSKLRTIGRHERTLRLPEVARFLEPSYTAIYATAQLIELLPADDHEQKVRTLVSALEACPGGSMRDFLEGRIKEIKSARTLRKSSRLPAVPAAPSATSANPTLLELIEARAQFDLAVLDISDKSAVIRADYAPGSSLVDCLPLREVMADGAAVLVGGRTSDIPAIVTKLLPACGFARPTDIILLRRPKTPRIINDQVVVVASRGTLQSSFRGDDDWLNEGEEVDLRTIAEQLYPDAVSKLHVFAEAQSGDWACLIGLDSWIKQPSVR